MGAPDLIFYRKKKEKCEWGRNTKSRSHKWCARNDAIMWWKIEKQPSGSRLSILQIIIMLASDSSNSEGGGVAAALCPCFIFASCDRFLCNMRIRPPSVGDLCANLIFCAATKYYVVYFLWAQASARVHTHTPRWQINELFFFQFFTQGMQAALASVSHSFAFKIAAIFLHISALNNNNLKILCPSKLEAGLAVETWMHMMKIRCNTFLVGRHWVKW